ncbi:MAG: hypothetical protein HDT43_09635 [Ruminococcaceae bacterium]|nr:hypothetical protein [Oscillospiraceae bacterium]
MSAKVYDGKGRFRGKIISFRCSEEENALLNAAVKLSGLTKQDYIINKVTNREVVVQPNTRVYKALKDKLGEVLAELKRIENGGKVDGDLIDLIGLINTTLDGINGGD